MARWIDNVDASDLVLLSHSAIVAPSSKVVYLPNPKAACTSIKTVLLEMEGLRLPSRISLSNETSREMTVHDRDIYPLDTLAELPASMAREILGSDLWYRFTVTRNPYSRFFSAWKDKVLFREPGVSMNPAEDRYGSDGQIEVGATFRCFVRAFAADPLPHLLDYHFMPQWRTTFHDHVQYSEVFHTDDTARLESVLRSRTGGEVTLPRMNEGLSLDWRSAYDEATLRLVHELYAEDFVRFGFDEGASVSGSAHRMEISTELVNQIRARNARITELSSIPLRYAIRRRIWHSRLLGHAPPSAQSFVRDIMK
jgi:hypothetical protein